MQLPYKLRTWVDKDKLIWYKLCQNPNAIDLVKQYPEKINWAELSLNENAIELLEQNIDKVVWTDLAIHNPRALELLQKYPQYLPDYKKLYCLCYNSNPDVIPLIKDKIEKNKHRIKFHRICRCDTDDESDCEEPDCNCYYCNLCLDWRSLSENPNAISILEQHSEKIDWFWISKNTNAMHLIEQYIDNIEDDLDLELLSANPNAIKFLKQHPELIDWKWLSENPNAMELLKQNPDKIDWSMLSRNPNPIAIEMLRQNPDKIDGEWLSYNKNPEAIELLELYQDKIHWWHFTLNPNIFVLDYEKMKENRKELNREIIQKAMHPTRIAKLLELGVNLDDI